MEELESLERRRLLQRELESFSAIDRKILLLSLVDGHSLADVALKLNLSHDAVRARKSRAVRKITSKFAGLSQASVFRHLSLSLGALWSVGIVPRRIRGKIPERAT